MNLSMLQTGVSPDQESITKVSVRGVLLEKWLQVTVKIIQLNQSRWAGENKFKQRSWCISLAIQTHLESCKQLQVRRYPTGASSMVQTVKPSYTTLEKFQSMPLQPASCWCVQEDRGQWPKYSSSYHSCETPTQSSLFLSLD